MIYISKAASFWKCYVQSTKRVEKMRSYIILHTTLHPILPVVISTRTFVGTQHGDLNDRIRSSFVLQKISFLELYYCVAVSETERDEQFLVCVCYQKINLKSVIMFNKS